MDIQHFTPAKALAGGALIGLAATATTFFTGRVAGISGIVGGLLRPALGEWRWRAAFIAGLLVGGVALMAVGAGADGAGSGAVGLIGAPVRSPLALAAAGLMVGFGARLGRGCTSGHGVCGIARLSPRSALATVIFMLTGMATVWVVRTTGWLGS